ncbi:FAD-dependent thymidylate synthase [Candidatus Woesearchaeota archaeon]|nr:FAD-dependent thymidylate synthase [Candidatus Woesearchaeota archaeon]
MVLLEEFTQEEKKILKPFFTNLDKPIFALINLPEVVKGALFSRYSRSTKSLRRVLLDEFIMKPEMGFKEIVGFKESKTEEQIIAVKKAEEFYDRVLVGYGDDSVAELGGANIACEQISQIAAKFIEGARIGISPLEKSTRYVWFNQKIKGNYQYVREQTLMNSRYADLYIETCDLLFDSYSNLIEPMTKYVMEKFPREDGLSDRAYNSAVRAKACDILRVFLPASTMTNVGLYGNGRAFEYLLVKMYAHPLAEIRELARSMHEELSKIIPSFVKRANDNYGIAAQQYISKTHKATSKFVLEHIEQLPQNADEVTLVDFDKDAEQKILQAIIYPYSKMSLEQINGIVKNMDDNKKEELINEYISRRMNRRHKPGRAFEHTYYTFDILSNYGIYRDLQRHRLLTQEPQDLTVIHGYDMPNELKEAGYEEEYHECMSKVKEAFRIIYKEYPKEAQYLVAFGYKIRWCMKMNLREVYHLTELRSMQQGHPDYRRVAQQIYLKVKQVHPQLTEHLKFVDMNEYDMERIEAEKKIDRKIEEINKKYN